MRPKRSLGQNFLRDDAVLTRIAQALDIAADDTVIEIGPGRGALTEKLVEHEARIIAIEIDRDLVPILRERFAHRENFTVREEDVLETDIFEDITPERVKVVGNLPYYISTPILQRLIGFRERCERAVLMLQQEVVDRITAGPGDRNRGFLTVLIEDAFVAEKLFDVPPSAFFPQPKVWSSVVRLTPSDAATTPDLRRLVAIGFSQKRKTILNNFKAGFSADISAQLLRAADIAPIRRAETITLAEWRVMARELDSLGLK